MLAFWRVHRAGVLLIAVSIVSYFLLGYVVQREHTYALIFVYILASLAYGMLMEREKLNFNFLWIAGLLFRLVFLFGLPALSQDFYRFIWDGHLVRLGFSPYESTPDQLIDSITGTLPNARLLWEGMGELSARHFSNYPPVNQAFFALGSWIGGDSILYTVLTLRLFIIGADVGVVFLLRGLLRRFNISTHHAFWYYLNPLVIVELSGNLHFEGIMVALFCLALVLMVRGRSWLSGLLYGASIGLKLVPLLFLPLILTHLNLRKSMALYLGVAIALILMVIPLYTPGFIGNYQETVGLWFSGFRFNAGIFGLVNWIATRFFGARSWILIGEWGTFVPVATVLCALVLMLYRRHRSFVQLTQAMMFLLGFYFLLTPTVHPWYLVFLLFLGVFGRIRFQIIWSVVVVFSYAAYREPEFRERHLLLALEYLFVFVTLIYDFVTYRKYDGKFNRSAVEASKKN